MLRARLGRWVLLLLLGLVVASPAVAQAPRTERILLAGDAGQTVRQGTIRGREVVTYLLSAGPGHWIRAELRAANPGAFLDVRAPGADTVPHIGEVNGNVFSTQVTEAGDYRLSVRLTRDAARAGETARYRLQLSLRDQPDATPPSAPAPADSFRQVTGLPRGQRLNLREGPSERRRIVGQLNAGEVLRSQGCRVEGRESWCMVARLDGTAPGWAAERYLRETAAPQGATPLAAPQVMLRPFDSTGLLPCAMIRGEPSRDCRFGVERRGQGGAIVEVLGSNGVTRRITFEEGAPARSDAEAELAFERFGPLFLIRIGDERFEVPEPLVTGR